MAPLRLTKDQSETKKLSSRLPVFQELSQVEDNWEIIRSQSTDSMSADSSKYLEELDENFTFSDADQAKAQSDSNETILKLTELKKMILDRDQKGDLVNLDDFQIPAFLLAKIDFEYHQRFLVCEARDFEYQEGKLLAVLDVLLQNYRRYGRDGGKSFLEYVDFLREEILLVMERYQRVREQMDQYQEMINRMCEIRSKIDQLYQIMWMEDDPEICSIHQLVLDELKMLEERIDQQKIDQLIDQAKTCQLKYNYYQGMINHLKDQLFGLF